MATSRFQTAGMDFRAVRIQRFFEVPILIASLLVVPTVILEEEPLSQQWHSVAVGLDWLTWSVFAAELVVMLWVVPDRRSWLRANPFALPVVLLTPPFLPAALQAARAVRLLRLFRFARAFRLLSRYYSLTGIRFIAGLVLFLVLGAGAAFADVERNYNLDSWDGVWWAMSTVTTVGYGDVSPHTAAGRAIAIALMIVGIGFVALLTAELAQRFMSTKLEDEQDREASLARSNSEILKRLDDLSHRLAGIEQAVRPPAP
jgi:voltage-gated potassium channel